MTIYWGDVRVLADLGDLGKRMQVICNRGRAMPGAYVTLNDLADCLE